MERKIGKLHAMVLGLFVVLALCLSSVGLFAIASKDGWAGESIQLESAVPSVSGLRVGAQVRVLGIPVGQVTQVQAPSAPGQPVVVQFSVSKQHQGLIREDAKLRIIKDGLVGERLVEIEPGTEQSATVTEGARIASDSTASWEEVVAKVDALVTDVTAGKGTVGKLLVDDSAHAKLLALADQGEQVLGRVGNIADEIQNGKGTAGKLVKEDAAYRQFEELVQRADLVLQSVDESHRSLKNTWPVSSIVQDKYSLLVHPDAQTHKKVFQESDLFEPGRAQLTQAGKAELDKVAKWLHNFDQWESDVVVAGFAQDEPDARMAELLSTKQAQAVRDYLEEKGAHRRGWVSRRGITAHGFGNSKNPNKNFNVPPRSIALLAFVK